MIIYGKENDHRKREFGLAISIPSAYPLVDYVAPTRPDTELLNQLKM
jgi:hypothetical protein